MTMTKKEEYDQITKELKCQLQRFVQNHDPDSDAYNSMSNGELNETISEISSLYLQYQLLLKEIHNKPDEDEDIQKQIAKIKTSRPTNLVSPISKIARETFKGDFYPRTLKEVNVQKRRMAEKNPVITKISIDIDDLEQNGVTIAGGKELTPYDREVHDAIVSLYVDGGNEFITYSMIFDTISGKKGATLNPKQRELLANSITKLMFSRVQIDASEEYEKMNYDQYIYDGYVVPAERVTVSLNGQVTDCIHLFRTPPLYDYADRKDEIGRMRIELLNTPVNKNNETIILQGYLYRRILAMKGKASLSRTIKYDSLYDYIGITAKTDGALRKKKSKIRDHVKKILEFWTEEKFINGYSETKKRTFESIIINL